MVFELVSPMLGFEDVKTLEMKKVDEFFVNVSANNGLSLTLVNPFALRNYSFDIPLATQILLDIKGGEDKKDSGVEVYCIVVLQSPLEDSKVNFLAPLIFNIHNKKAMQIVLNAKDYPDFARLETLKDFAK